MIVIMGRTAAASLVLLVRVISSRVGGVESRGARFRWSAVGNLGHASDGGGLGLAAEL